jgi:hypothetical protein
MASNSKQWSSATPGYIIFLVDQSGSMSESYPENGNKANFTAKVINRTINELINVNMNGAKVKDRVFISIIGDGNPAVNEIRSDYLSTYADNPIRIDQGKQKQSDGNGGLIEIDVQNPVWIEPVANMQTPMGSALEFAKKLMIDWMQKKINSPIPVIINVSDGLPFPYEEEQKVQIVAKEIMALSCNDGNPLIFNVHIGDGLEKCVFSELESEITNEEAKFLFSISSKFPDAYKKRAKKTGLEVKDDSKCFVSNTDIDNLYFLFNYMMILE